MTGLLYPSYRAYTKSPGTPWYSGTALHENGGRDNDNDW